MLKKYIYLLIVIFVFSCSDIESDIIGKWRLSLAQAKPFPSEINYDLNKYHKKELLDKFNSNLEEDIFYIFKPQGILIFKHSNSSIELESSGSWKTDSDKLIVQLLGQSKYTYTIKLSDNVMTLSSPEDTIVLLREE